ncbi:hypothetical protein DWV81_25065 [Escherichia coli]|nr:hypothetical protein DWV81_25065 [Escherichia coli]
MEKIDIVADQLQLDRALNKLIHNLVEESQLTLGETLSAWELCEKLSMQQFMALKKNVYFADLLRAVEISLPLRQTLHVDGAEIRQVETEFEEKPEVARDEPVMECLRIPALSTSLETIQLPERFMKLIKRLKNIQLINPNFVPGETFGDSSRCQSTSWLNSLASVCCILILLKNCNSWLSLHLPLRL